MTTLRSHDHYSPHRRPLRWVTALLTSAALVVATAPIADADPSVNAEQDQQAALAQLNAARWSPVSFAADFGIELTDTLPQPPVAVNAELTDSARFKADEISDNDYFSHQSAVTGTWPNELARIWGYDLPLSFPDDSNNIESLHSGSPSPPHVIASFVSSPTHRAHVLGQGWFASLIEVGVGRSETENVWTVHTGYRDGAGPFVTGTVFNDLNGDGVMEAGEGLGGVTVMVGSSSTTTNAGGGYSIEVPAGTYTITANGPGFAGTSAGKATVSLYNVGADFISGTQAPTVRSYELCEGLQPTILGTSGNDVIYGTDGPDIIHGLDGNDVIYGLGGDDIICGGDGRNKIRGGKGDDRLIGGRRNDKLFGDAGSDTLLGGRGKDKLVGGPGRDTLLGGGGRDTIKGNSSNDTLDGGRSIDYLDGGAQTDTCTAGETLLRCP